VTESVYKVARGLTYRGVFIVSLLIMLPTLGIDTWAHGKITWVSEIVLGAIAVITALKTRLNDIMATYWAPPIVWFVSLETTGQYGRDFHSENLKSQAIHLGYGLANHAPAIIGSTFLAVAIAAIRRARRP
jgi:hypothetical protein